MWLLIFIVYLNFKDSLECRSDSYIYVDTKNIYFSNSSTWGGWNPPPGNDSWKMWITLWGTQNNSRYDSTEEDRGAETGWPLYWKGLGEGNRGVPPPPWAHVPFSYGKPQFCFLQPARGNCNFTMTRWGFNPTFNNCQTFLYSGCGANQNNFLNRQNCIKACVDVPSTGCEAQSKINFEEFIYE